VFANFFYQKFLLGGSFQLQGALPIISHFLVSLGANLGAKIKKGRQQ
jgi:hypothetical protein